MDDDVGQDGNEEKGEYELLHDKRVVECRAAAQSMEDATKDL